MQKNNPKIPKIFCWLLDLVTENSDKSHLNGDYEEIYGHMYKNEGKIRAFLWVFKQVLKSSIFYFSDSVIWRLIMLRNYLKISLRSIRKHKMFSLINISGLTIGMATFILIMMLVHSEMSFDRFHTKYDNIFRVIRFYPGTEGRNEMFIGGTPAPLGPTLLNDFSEVLDACRIGESKGTFKYKNIRFSESGIFADDHFFKMFSFKLLTGNKENALKHPFSVIITEKIAKKYFANENPVGKTINFNKQMNPARTGDTNETSDLTITGIIKEIPKNSHLKFDYIISFNTLFSTTKNKIRLDWPSSQFYNYIELQPDYPPENINEKIAGYSRKYRDNDPGKYILQPMHEVHWTSSIMDEMTGVKIYDKKYILIFSSIGFIILLLACINYMNLSTARFSRRLTEIGIRRVAGAKRQDLIRQFLGESLYMSITSAFLSLPLTVFLIPVFSSFTGRDIDIEILKSSNVFVTIIVMILFTGIISGSYPAFFLTSFQPVNVLKGSTMNRLKGSKFRNSLVFLQYVISIFLIFSTLVIYNQLLFVKSRDIGYNRENVVVMPLLNDEARENGNIIMNEFLQKPEILNVSNSEFTPLERNNVLYTDYMDKVGEQKKLMLYTCEIGYDFFNVFDIKTVNGRVFSIAHPSDKGNSVLLNETAVNRMNLTDPIGQILKPYRFKIIGIVKDFNQSSLHDKIDPMVFILRPENFTYISSRIRPEDIPGTLAFMKKTVEKYSPNFTFDYYFQDDYFDSKYKTDRRFGSLFGYFSILAIFIAGMGLFGLSSFSIEKRTKEIAVRKIMGASFHTVINQLLKEFLKTVLLANIIALPAAYYVMRKWLQNFAYHTAIGAEIYLLAALIALLIAVLTISYQTIKAACANPVDALRHE